MAKQNNPARACFLTPTVSVFGAGLSSAADEQVFKSELHRFKVARITRGLEHPWSLAFLPDGAMLVTERPERLRLVRQLDPGTLGLPIQVYAFCIETDFKKYEAVQADIFDHLLSILPEFELRAFQNVASPDAVS